MFYVGGGNGDWVINPNESYNTWAARNCFQVNDTLCKLALTSESQNFKYAKGSDSVQLVTKADFEGCNIKNPLEKFDNGEAEVTLNRSGAFYFVSGDRYHCTKGQNFPGESSDDCSTSKAHSPVSPISPAKAPSTSQPPQSSVSPAPEMIPPSPPAPSELTPTIKAPASSPKNAASGVAVTSVMTTEYLVVHTTVSRLSHLQSLPIRGRVKTPCVASWILDRIFGAVYGTRERPSWSIDLRSSYSRSKEKGLDGMELGIRNDCEQGMMK
ncbi:hypothetical protein YC2023_035551 [Brassica napus]